MQKRGLSRLALILAPVLALAACDQAQDIWDRMQTSVEPPAERAGPVPLESVPVEARAVAGVVLPAAEMELMTAMPELAFVPGEILVGAKVVDAVAREEGMSPAAFMRQRLAGAGGALPVLEALDLDPALLDRATEAAVDRARDNARTVLDRLRVEGEISAVTGGVVKIDLTPSGASPTRFQTEGAEAPAEGGGEPLPLVEPAAAEETPDLRCPPGVTEAQLDADIALKTQCAVERLRASRQFEFVDKNYVIQTAMDRFPWNRPAPPTAPPTTPSTGGGKPAPGAPAGPPAAPAALTLPNDPLLPLQWSYRTRGDAPGEAPGGAGFERFWLGLKQTGSRAVRVAVIDTGVDLSHPDFVNSPNLGPGIDFINSNDRAGDGDGIDADANDVGDACGPTGVNSYHGTHVTGTIGGAPTNKRRGVSGGAWNVTVVPVRALGRCGGELEDVINALRWSAGLGPAVSATGTQIVNPAPVDVINMSLSVPVACPASMQSAIDAAVAKGVIVVVAAGNKARETRIFAPANCNNVLVVGAADRVGALSFYSNFGPEVDVIAPGGDMFGDSDGDGRPDGILSTRTTRANCTDPQTKTPAAVCYYSYLHGTSMAAPHVSAALALLKSQFNVTGKALEDLLFTRAVAPVDAAKCQIACERNASATPIPGQAGQCMRACGRGALDLGLAAAQPAPAAAPGGQP